MNFRFLGEDGWCIVVVFFVVVGAAFVMVVLVVSFANMFVRRVCNLMRTQDGRAQGVGARNSQRQATFNCRQTRQSVTSVGLHTHSDGQGILLETTAKATLPVCVCLSYCCSFGRRCRDDRGRGSCWLFESAAHKVAFHGRPISSYLVPW